MSKKKTEDKPIKYIVLKSFVADRLYSVGEVFETSKKVEYLKTNKYIKIC